MIYMTWYSQKNKLSKPIERLCVGFSEEKVALFTGQYQRKFPPALSHYSGHLDRRMTRKFSLTLRQSLITNTVPPKKSDALDFKNSRPTLNTNCKLLRRFICLINMKEKRAGTACYL